MKILLAGGSGFIGSHLARRLGQHHQITILSRQSLSDQTYATLSWQSLTPQIIAQFDSVINLCGDNIAAARWSSQRKAAIMQSRVETTRQLVNDILACRRESRPHLYNASAIGIYGSHAIVPCNEQQALSEQIDFLSQVAIEWEQAVQPAIDQDVAVTLLRFGVVLGHDGGMMAKLWLPYRLGLAGKIGNGEQLLSWIHIDDVVAIIDYLLAHSEMTGPFNLVAPQAVSQRTFSKTLAAALHRPSCFAMPALVVKLLYGQMGQELLLSGAEVIPQRLIEIKYPFKFSDIHSAIQALVKEYNQAKS